MKLRGLRDESGPLKIGGYVTLDWDRKGVAELLDLRQSIQEDPRVQRAWIRGSSHKGYHALLEVSPGFQEATDKFRIRRLYRDDTHRIEWDRGRGHPEGVLFDWKHGKFSGPWRRFK